jgi:hypothetical protein
MRPRGRNTGKAKDLPADGGCGGDEEYPAGCGTSESARNRLAGLNMLGPFRSAARGHRG